MHQAAQLVRKDELMRLLLAGHMLKECAVFLKLSYGTVREYARQPEFLQQLKGLSLRIYENVDRELASNKDGITARLEAFSEEALEEMMKLARESGGIVKLKACQDLMDRDTRISRQRKIEATQNHQFMNPLELQHIAMVAREVDRKQAEPPALPEAPSE
jgi:hypothetical protein